MMVDAINSGYEAYNSSRGIKYQDASSASDGANTATSDTPTADTTSNTATEKRTIHDTISLSNGSKMVNLERGFSLAEEARAEKDPEKFKELLKAGFEDIKRIGQLFTETFKTLRNLFGF